MPRNTSWGGDRASFPKSTRAAILRRQPMCATGCGRASQVADHIIPHAEGGSDHMSNGQALCHPCHDQKTKLERARGKLRARARRPDQTHPGIVDQ